jgi:hypothetical protein
LQQPVVKTWEWRVPFLARILASLKLFFRVTVHEKSCFLRPERAVQNGILLRKIALPFQGEENIRERLWQGSHNNFCCLAAVIII